MFSQNLKPQRGTQLRKTDSTELIINVEPFYNESLFLINGYDFITANVTQADLIIKPNSYFMIINNSNEEINVRYSMDISHLEIMYDPYKFEKLKKIKIDPDKFVKIHSVPEGYSEILPKWYSIKFSYSNHNLIYIKPEMGISIQLHEERSENWEILKGYPIVLSGNKVHYNVKSGSCFSNPKNFYHAVINPNKKKDDFVVLREKWAGKFDENDIIRVFNPNHYYS
ncbi:MAG: hypothetical protein MUP85_05485 [Candidatus Lokiarchaeota archaeon]|nr:hypothetical protein [Candidatus Lokiarchaeota archaeon]